LSKILCLPKRRNLGAAIHACETAAVDRWVRITFSSQMTCVRGGTYAGLALGCVCERFSAGPLFGKSAADSWAGTCCEMSIYFSAPRIDKELLVELLGTIRVYFSMIG
jgi:hypothetical protein